MELLERAVAAIDEANAADPTLWNGEPLALVQGRLAHRWVLTLDPAASVALQLAARAHHLRRWTLPRSDYPEGRAGYLRWRRDQAGREARELAEILAAIGLDTVTIERAGAIVRKSGLGTDVEVQTFEDAVCLAFVETQLASTAERLEPDRIVAVLVKTLAKMSEAGRRAAETIALDPGCESLVRRAITEATSG